MLTHDDFTEIKKVLDDRYVMQSDCNDIQERNNKRFANDDKRIEKQEEFNAGLKKLGWAIFSILVSEMVLSLLSLLHNVS